MMACRIDFHEVLIDSPNFRYKLEEQEQEIENLETKLDKILKLATASCDSGRQFIVNQSAFATSLWELQKHFPDDKDALTKIIHCLQEMNKFHNILLEQCSKTVLKNISNFLKKDIREVKDYKQIFSKISENYDGALYKNSQVNKNRLQEIIEAENYVFSTKSQFQHSALDYVNYITMLQSKKRPEILSTLLSYVSACSTYFHQGSDLCQDYDTYLFKELDEEVNTMRNEYNQLEKTMQKRHNYVNGFLDEPKEDDPKVTARQMEGYLFKRTSNAFKTWNRRWFYMKDNKLYYRKRSGEELPTIMEDDLKLCTVRPVTDSDRRFCFEVISPTKSHILQADSENQYQAWVQALQSGIGHAIQNNSRYSSNMCASSSTKNQSSSSMAAPTNKSKEKKINWRQMLMIPGNMKCADCGNPDPKWASINLGITLCIACSGVHRSLGVHYSKVRSLTLDVWEPEILRVMMELGNEVVNKIYEGAYDELLSDVERATENCDDDIRKKWIHAKYVERKFVLPLNDSKKTDLLPPNLLPSPSKWTVKKYRRRAARRHINNNNDVKITSKEHDNSEDEKEVNESILMLGDRLAESSYSLIPESCRLFTNSDQESTSGDEDVLDEEEIDKLHPNYVLYKATTAHNLPVMCQAISLGADKNWENPENLNRTPLHQAILAGSLMTCEFLLLNGANINCADLKGFTPLHLSIEIGNTALAYLLLKHKAKYDLTTNDGKLPIDFAVSTANADVVTLLRLHQLNEEIGATDDGEPGGDSTYNDVMRDFSHLANNQRLRSNRKDGGSSSSSSIANSNNMDTISME